ncbi:MAG: septum formation inhibitor [Lachnospiraceae bacterium]|nr:septum formation inhibitor [Lachnospiraceae bacterium]
MNKVIIKSFQHGIRIKMDPDADFEDIYKELIEKFNASAKFFGKAKLVIEFEGRALSEEEEEFLVNCITENTDITISCVIGVDENTENQYIKAAGSFSENSINHPGQFYKGCIKSGEILETDSSLIILGDVYNGAKVSASGNIIILGTLYGSVHAGCFGDDKSFVVALDIKNTRVRIADYSEMIQEKSGLFLKNKAVPKIIYVKDDRLEALAITTDNLNNLPF